MKASEEMEDEEASIKACLEMLDAQPVPELSIESFNRYVEMFPQAVQELQKLIGAKP